jgi:hypothetical protein
MGFILIDYRRILRIVTPFEPTLIMCVGFCGLFGVTLSLCLASDLLSLVTWHVDTLHTLFALLYSNALTALGFVTSCFCFISTFSDCSHWYDLAGLCGACSEARS